jgi:predicted phosphodiesterase
MEWSERETQRLLQLHEHGLSSAQIAQKLNRSVESVKCKLKRMKNSAKLTKAWQSHEQSANNQSILASQPVVKLINGKSHDKSDVFGILSGQDISTSRRGDTWQEHALLGRERRYSVIHNGPSLEVMAHNPIIVAVLGDIHFPFEDPAAMALAKQIIISAKPDIVILNGDIPDFFGISKFPVPPIRRAQFANEIAYTKDQIPKLKEFAPHAFWVWLEGNHELRLQMHLWRRAPELAELLFLEEEFELSKSGILYLKQPQEPQLREDFVAPQVKLGKLYVTHGHLIRTWGYTINVARSIFLRVQKPMLVGHHHRKDIYIQTDYEGIPSGSFVHGCLARPRPHWDIGRIWGQGLAIVAVTNGYFECDVIDFIKTKEGRLELLFALWRGQRYEVPVNTRSW